jgi:hypothetical protein
MDGLKIPSIRQLITLAISMLVLLFIIRLVVPENIKQWFRV